MPRAS